MFQFSPAPPFTHHFTMVTSPAKTQTCVFLLFFFGPFSFLPFETHLLSRHCKEFPTPSFSSLSCRVLWALDCLWCSSESGSYLFPLLYSAAPPLSLCNHNVLVIGPPHRWTGNECTPQLLRFHFLFCFPDVFSQCQDTLDLNRHLV